MINEAVSRFASVVAEYTLTEADIAAAFDAMHGQSLIRPLPTQFANVLDEVNRQLRRIDAETGLAKEEFKDVVAVSRSTPELDSALSNHGFW